MSIAESHRLFDRCITSYGHAQDLIDSKSITAKSCFIHSRKIKLVRERDKYRPISCQSNGIEFARIRSDNTVEILATARVPHVRFMQLFNIIHTVHGGQEYMIAPTQLHHINRENVRGWAHANYRMEYCLAHRRFMNARLDPELVVDPAKDRAWRATYAQAKKLLKVTVKMGVHEPHLEEFAKNWGFLDEKRFHDDIANQNVLGLIEQTVRSGYLYGARYPGGLKGEEIITKFESLYEARRTKIRELAGAITLKERFTNGY